MKKTKLVLLGMAMFVAASGCDGEVKQNTTGDAGSGGEPTTGGGGAGGTATTGGGGKGGEPTTGGGGTGGVMKPTGDPALAVHLLRIGDQLPDGTPSTTAWMDYGFDLDAKV